MSVLVVDASVAVKWFVEEEHSDAALSLLDERHELHAPDFMLLEVDSLLANWVRGRVLASSEGDDIRDALRRFPVQTHGFVELLDSAWVIANQSGATVYDALYVALALLLKGKLVTADRKLCEMLAGGRFAKHAMSVEQVR